jgi:hypothetical protein
MTKIIQLVELMDIVREYLSCSKEGIMEWWNIGKLRKLLDGILWGQFPSHFPLPLGGRIPVCRQAGR